MLLAHYGATLTDLPEDCAAMEELAADLLPALPAEWLAAAPAAPVADSFSAAFGAAPAAPQADGGPFEAGFDTPLEAFDAPEPGGPQDLDAPTEALAAPTSPAAPAAPAAQPEAPKAPAVDLAALGFGAGN